MEQITHANKGKTQSLEHIQKRNATRKANDINLGRVRISPIKGQTKNTNKNLQSKYKGKTFEEIHGIDKALEIKNKIREKRALQTFTEDSKKRQQENSSIAIKKLRTGKTLEEIYGIERAKEIKEKLRKSHLGVPLVKTPNRILGYKKTSETKRNNPDLIRGGNSKYYDTPIGQVQGTLELKYINNLIQENKQLPTKPKGVQTSLGNYFPDFEFSDKFIEIKSKFTYDVFKGKELTRNKTYDLTQLNKAIEVSRNVKPVEVLVLDRFGNVTHSEIL